MLERQVQRTTVFSFILSLIPFLFVFFAFLGVLTAGTAASETIISGQTITSNATWTLAGSPYVVTGLVTVAGTSTIPATLTIEPGVVVKFNSGIGLKIGNGTGQGALIARGTSTNKITFTRSTASVTWAGITFNDATVDATTMVEYADIQYATTGMTMNTASPTIKDTTILATSSTGHGMNLANSNPMLDNVSMTNDGTYGLYLNTASPTISGGSIVNTNATGQGIYGSGSPIVSNCSVSVVNSAGKYGIKLSSGVTSSFTLMNSAIANGLYIGTTSISPTITGNTFTNVDNSPMHAGANIIANILNNNTLNGMTSAGKIEVVGEQVKQDATWKKWAAPYVVSGTVSIYKDTTAASTLTIEPGTVLKFDSSVGIKVGVDGLTSKGCLVAQGTADSRITFTRSGTSGTWAGITFYDGTVDSATILENADVLYTTGVAMNSASPTIKNSSVTNVTGLGMNLAYSNPVLDNVTISTSGGIYGIYLSSSSPTITGGSLTNSYATGHGIYGSGSPAISSYTVSIVNTAGKYGIYSTSATSTFTLTNSTIGNGLYLSSVNITPTISGNTFTNSDSSPVHAGANIVGSILNNNTFTDMSSAGKIEVVAEQMKQDSLWKKWPAPYVITSTVYVYKDAASASTLTIDPAVVVKFNTNTGLQIGNGSYRGVLIAQGTADSKIRFTSNQSAPAPGDWTGLTFSGAASSASFLEHAVVEYGGSAGNSSNANIVVSGSAPSIRNCGIMNSKGNGIYLTSATATPGISGCSISSNKWGIYSSYSNPVISNSSITGNTTAGVWNASPTYTVDARNNWWGNATGPRHASNSSGSGDIVGDYVLFSPWLTQEPGASTLEINDTKAQPAALNPEGDYILFTATISEAANWTVVIADSSSNPVRRLIGSGTSVNIKWFGENDLAQKVPDDGYYYWIEAVSTATGGHASSPQGLLIISRLLPVAIIDQPADNQMFTEGSIIAFNGTAVDTTDFKQYSLQYGLGESPASWLTIKTATSPVTNGLLYSWDTSLLTGDQYTLKLTVTDNANNIAVETIRVRLLRIQNAAVSESFISPNGDAKKDTATITAASNYPLSWTVTIKNPSGEVVRTMTQTGSTLGQTWDGKDDRAAVVPDGVYTWVINAASTETGVTAPQKTGQATVDATLPMAVMTAPAAGAVLQNAVTIMGTASDANLESYQVEYGPASGAGPWTLVTQSPSSVTAGTLATWTTNDGTNAVLLANGNYALRLNAADKAGNSTTTTVPVNVDNLTFANISISSNTLNTYTSQQSTVFFTINAPATATFKIIPEKQGPTGTPVHQATQACAASGAYSFTWDGKNSAGLPVPDEAYLYILEASDGARTDVYSPPQPAGTGTATCSQEATFDFYKNDPLTISYSLPQAARVSINISWGPQNFPIMSANAVPAGAYSFDWNGRDPAGTVLDNGAKAYCSVASLLRENHIVTSGDTFIVSNFKADPYAMSLSFGQFTRISYTLSREAIVTVKLIAPSGAALTLVDGENQTAGVYQTEWRGLDTADVNGKRFIVAEEGDYTVWVKTVNPTTGTGGEVRGYLRVGY